jgi:hypothetical protein
MVINKLFKGFNCDRSALMTRPLDAVLNVWSNDSARAAMIMWLDLFAKVNN